MSGSSSGYGYSIPGIDPSVAVPYTAGNTPASQTWSGTGAAPAWWDSKIGTEQMPGGDAAWGDKLTKALGDLTKANAAGQQSQGGGGGGGGGAMAPAQSGTGGGRGANLDTLVQLLQQRYQALYPGGGSSKGLLGV